MTIGSIDPKHPTDEPPSIVPERIRAEREVAGRLLNRNTVARRSKAK